MQNNETLQQLNQLYNHLVLFNAEKIQLASAKQALSDARIKPLTSVSDYDKEHKAKYIIDRIGEEPVKPNKALVLAVPLFIKKKKEYEEKIDSYKKAYTIIENEYYQKHRKIREEIATKEKEEKENLINEAQNRFDEIYIRYEKYKSLVESCTLVSEKLKSEENIKTIIEYFEDGRADTIKEAINLLYEEKHRQRVEALTREQLELTQKISNTAQEALSTAEDALSAANDAMNLAREAYDLAENAYSSSNQV